MFRVKALITCEVITLILSVDKEGVIIVLKDKIE